MHGKSIICFGGEDWWYHHPHSKAHLMRKFASAGNKVIFVNSISMGLPGLAHKDLLPRIKRKLGSYSKLARQTEEGITVVSPASLPFFGTAVARSVNRRLLSAQIGKLARSRGLTKPVLWIAIPTAAEMIGTLDESAVVYQVSDKYEANTMDHATDPALIRRLHEHAIDAAEDSLADLVHDEDPGDAGEHRDRREPESQQHERRADAAERAREPLPDHLAQGAARRLRQQARREV